MPFDTIAEYPPMKFTFSFEATLSRVFAIFTKSRGFLQQADPTIAIGVTDRRLLITGTPNSLPISSPVFTKSFASRRSFSSIFLQVSVKSEDAQSSNETPIVIVRTSRFSARIQRLVSRTSLMLIIAVIPYASFRISRSFGSGFPSPYSSQAL